MDTLQFNSLNEMKKWFEENYGEDCSYQLVVDVMNYASDNEMSIDRIDEQLSSFLYDIMDDSEITAMVTCIYDMIVKP